MRAAAGARPGGRPDPEGTRRGSWVGSLPTSRSLCSAQSPRFSLGAHPASLNEPVSQMSLSAKASVFPVSTMFLCSS